jgi:hypothetical protein
MYYYFTNWLKNNSKPMSSLGFDKFDSLNAGFYATVFSFF